MTGHGNGSVRHPDRLDGHASHTYDAAQLRLDTWNALRDALAWLTEARRSGADELEPARRVEACLRTLRGLEVYWAFPGPKSLADMERLFARREIDDLQRLASRIGRLLSGDAYRDRVSLSADAADEAPRTSDAARPYFELLVVDAIDQDEKDYFRDGLAAVRRDQDEFIYDVLAVPSFEDALIAIQFNHTIQAAVLRYNFPLRRESSDEVLGRYLDFLPAGRREPGFGLARSVALGRLLKERRPELDLFLVTDSPLEAVAGRLGADFRRAFYRLDNFLELHLSILKGIRSRYETPFFDALRRYALKPTGVFHALPISRGKSLTRSHWIRDMAAFYGSNIFLAETSATSGGLDSLLQPHGPIKRAQQAAARAFGSKRTYFVTNGTSTANKIVVQALVRPGDIVLLSHDCHKSHHYAIMLAGAMPVYLDAYALTEFTMYGAVPLAEMKRRLLELKRAGKLDRVRMVLLTNCTFDGITYDPERVMLELLAIKPDLIFVWDEAWFAFATFHPLLRRRTAMAAAAHLADRLRSAEYRAAYAGWREGFDAAETDDDAWVNAPLMADPDLSRIRVYATHSTHKTLTALRQGSMIHVFDEDFEHESAEAFDEAFMTHTSTSPNYQILASLDVGRRQVELEGYELVQKSISLAMALRERIYEHSAISRYFSVLRPADMIPEEHRPSGITFYYDPERGWARMEDAWRRDEFALDPSRVTVHVGRTGIDGDTLRNLLMDDYDIQVNKTSRNTALFMTNIGMTNGDVAYLVEVLASIAGKIDERDRVAGEIDRRQRRERVDALTRQPPPLPNFSRFHGAFRDGGASGADGGTPEGDIRRAFFLAYDRRNCEHVPLGDAVAAVASGRELVSASFVTPYPPGFPILVPGQVISGEILAYLTAVDVKEIHGYYAGHGLRIFTDAALARAIEADHHHAVSGD